MQDYADWVIDHLDTGNWISHRLYRQHAVRDGPVFIKDLSKLGREIKNMIIVDNVAQNFTRQQENGIHIKSWFDDSEDTALIELGPILEEIRNRGYTDMRRGLTEVIGGEAQSSAIEDPGSGSSPHKMDRLSSLSIKRGDSEEEKIGDIFA